MHMDAITAGGRDKRKTLLIYYLSSELFRPSPRSLHSAAPLLQLSPSTHRPERPAEMAYPSAPQTSLPPLVHDGYRPASAGIVERRPSNGTDYDGGSIDKAGKGGMSPTVVDKEQQILAAELAKDEAEVEADREARHAFYQRFRPFILGGLALLILGWWISATVMPATRHRW